MQPNGPLVSPACQYPAVAHGLQVGPAVSVPLAAVAVSPTLRPLLGAIVWFCPPCPGHLAPLDRAASEHSDPYPRIKKLAEMIALIHIRALQGVAQ